MNLRREYAFLVFLLLLALAASGCGSSSRATPMPAGTGAIEGYVYARAARSSAPAAALSRQMAAPEGTVALNDATVTVNGTTLSDKTHADQRGSGGYFHIVGVPAGSHTITVTHSGYADISFPAAVTSGSTTSVGTTTGQTILEPTSASGKRKWTFMVYMDGDNDLEQFGVLNMNQMEQVGSDANVNLVVQFDRSPGFDQTNGDWTDCRRFLVMKDNDTQNMTSPLLQDLGEIDVAKPAALQDFLTWASTNYPADHYALVLWNHGAGWRSRQVNGLPTRGILFDDSSNTFMTMADLNASLDVPNLHLDIIAMDASLMGMLEVCYEIRERTPLLAVSEESPPGPGYPYHRILGKLAANPSMSAEDLGRIFVAEHVNHYTAEAVTQSLIDTSKLAAYAQTTDAFGAALQAASGTGNNMDLIGQARARSQSYAYSFYHDLFDLAKNAQALVADPSVQSAAQAVMDGLPVANGGPVIVEGHNALPGVANSHGLSVYAPGPGQFYSAYKDLRFSQDAPHWGAIVEAMGK